MEERAAGWEEQPQPGFRPFPASSFRSTSSPLGPFSVCLPSGPGSCLRAWCHTSHTQGAAVPTGGTLEKALEWASSVCAAAFECRGLLRLGVPFVGRWQCGGRKVCPGGLIFIQGGASVRGSTQHRRHRYSSVASKVKSARRGRGWPALNFCIVTAIAVLGDCVHRVGAPDVEWRMAIGCK